MVVAFDSYKAGKHCLFLDLSKFFLLKRKGPSSFPLSCGFAMVFIGHQFQEFVF